MDAALEELRSACEAGSVGVVACLLGRSDVLATLDEPDRGYFGGTALSYASEKGHDVVVCMLLDSGASSGAPDRSGLGPLHLAAQHGHTRVVQALLEERAPTDAQDQHSVTPLQFASRQGHAEVVQLLVAHGATVDIMGGERRTSALWQAVERGHTQVAQLLLGAGADPGALDTTHHETCAHLAARRGDLLTMQAILSAQPQLQPQEQQHTTRGSSLSGPVPVAVAAIVSARSRLHSTPLHFAASCSAPSATEVAAALLDAGADPSARDSNGFNAEELAASLRNFATEKLCAAHLNRILMVGARQRLAWGCLLLSRTLPSSTAAQEHQQHPATRAMQQLSRRGFDLVQEIGTRAVPKGVGARGVVARRHLEQLVLCERVHSVLYEDEEQEEEHGGSGSGRPHDAQHPAENVSWRGRLAVALAAAEAVGWNCAGSSAISAVGREAGTVAPSGVRGVLTKAREVLAELRDTEMARAEVATEQASRQGRLQSH